MTSTLRGPGPEADLAYRLPLGQIYSGPLGPTRADMRAGAGGAECLEGWPCPDTGCPLLAKESQIIGGRV